MSEAYPKLAPGMLVPLPKGHKVIDICIFKGSLIVATDKGVYLLKEPGNVLEPIRFVKGVSNE